MPTQDRSPAPSAPRLSPAVRIGLSLLIFAHLWALISRPMEFATAGPFGPSPSVAWFRAPVRAYTQFAYLDHGYAFFAPDPGPSHLIEVTLVAPDGTEQRRVYPDLRDQRPRLLYHRHFMLAEFLNDLYHPGGEPPPELLNNPEALRAWRQARRRYETLRDSIRHRLRTRYPDHQVIIRRLEHRPPGLPEFMQEGVQLDDPSLYEILIDMEDNEEEAIAPPVIELSPGGSQEAPR